MYLCTWAHAQNHCTMEGLPRLGRCRIYEGEVFGRSGGRAGNVLLDLKIGWAGAGAPAGKVVPRAPLKSRVVMGGRTQMTPPGVEPV